MLNKALPVLLMSLALAGCGGKVDSLNNYNVDESFADLSITDMYTRYYSNNRLQTTVTAPVADRYSSVKQPYLEFPKGVKVVFLDEQLREESSLTADYAVYYNKKKLWEARNNVVITNEDGTRLITEQIFGDENREKIFSVKKVTVVDPDSTVIVGKSGFESDMAFKNYKFLDVNGSVMLKEQYDEEIAE
ncbi:MAG: LPS export ABC transporter periplasmic protein LptC [Bacteroidales bacterium]|nr:LPS export ABC transporter periplasmic protein LptC [Bacteroidales bacterium]